MFGRLQQTQQFYTVVIHFTFRMQNSQVRQSHKQITHIFITHFFYFIWMSRHMTCHYAFMTFGTSPLLLWMKKVKFLSLNLGKLFHKSIKNCNLHPQKNCVPHCRKMHQHYNHHNHYHHRRLVVVKNVMTKGITIIIILACMRIFMLATQ